MREDIPVEEWPSALAELRLDEIREQFWLARFDPLQAWCEYMRFLHDGRKPN